MKLCVMLKYAYVLLLLVLHSSGQLIVNAFFRFMSKVYEDIWSYAVSKWTVKWCDCLWCIEFMSSFQIYLRSSQLHSVLHFCIWRKTECINLQNLNFPPSAMASTWQIGLNWRSCSEQKSVEASPGREIPGSDWLKTDSLGNLKHHHLSTTKEKQWKK